MESKLAKLKLRHSNNATTNHKEILVEIIDRLTRSRNLIVYNEILQILKTLGTNEIQFVSYIFRQIDVQIVPLNVLL